MNREGFTFTPGMVIDLAREAGLVGEDDLSTMFSTIGNVEYFAELVAQWERERCAALCEQLADLWDDAGHPGKSAGAQNCALEIIERIRFK